MSRTKKTRRITDIMPMRKSDKKPDSQKFLAERIVNQLAMS